MKVSKKASARAKPQSPPMTKRQLSKHRREQRLRRIILGAISAALILTFAVIGYGYYREVLHKGDQAIATVHGQAISTELYARYLGYQELLLNREGSRLSTLATQGDTSSPDAQAAAVQLQALQSQSQSLQTDALLQLVEGGLIREEAAKQNLTATPDEMDNALRREFAEYPPFGGLPEDVNKPFTGTLTVDDAKQELSKIMGQGRTLTDAEHRQLLLESTVLWGKLAATLGDQVKASQEQVKARQILVDTQDEANQVKARIDGGEDFAKVASEVSKDTATKDKGGDLGWFPKGIVDSTVETAAFGLQPGQVAGPVQGSLGFYLVKVEDRSDDRALTQDQLDQLRFQKYQDWLSSQMSSQSGGVEYSYTSDKIQWVSAFLTRELKPQ